MTRSRGLSVRRVLVATDRSRTADYAVQWAAEMAERYDAELVLLQVVAGEDPEVVRGLTDLAKRAAGPRGRIRLVVSDDASQAIVETAESENADVLVVGNVGMSGRKEFLLGNVPNRVSHKAPCTVIIVNTREAEDSAPRRMRWRT